MAFLQLSSNNPKFSYILRKNPESGMIVRNVREGHLFGYYSSENNIFNCFFKDSNTEISYKRFEDEFEYVNPSRYNAPEFVLDTIKEFFRHIIKESNEEDSEGYNNYLMINMINIKRKYLDIFGRYFTNIYISSEEICANNFRLKFSTNGTLRELLSFGQIFAFFHVLKNRYVEDDEIEKYMNQLVSLKAPYFIKYVFKINVLKRPKMFIKFKKILEDNSFEKIEFQYGHISDQRMRTIENLLKFERSIVDFGCGEGEFVRRFYPRLLDSDNKNNEDNKKRYYAIDKDDEKLNIIKKRIERMENGENIILGATFPELVGIDGAVENVDVIMSEVIEHMTKEESTRVVKEILSRQNVKSLIITTPNKDFNQFFFFDEDEMRHEAHIFEMGKEEFGKWVEEIKNSCDCGENKRNVQLLEIGDRVNDIPVTLGVVIRNVQY